ncbi:hypothetical protein CO2235_200057 [Cupriavidus oxalaticus]|uniref:Uncharacterized protein n=1 Tax=Cupriavidus oxalaticus TaxID=96344 RepID=A0A375G3H5_9BURK|nr:hypothetical protein CO2235_200057 [Cupriavidus oxalaticus]
MPAAHALPRPAGDEWHKRHPHNGPACRPACTPLPIPHRITAPRASYNGHYLSFPSRNGLTKPTVHAGYTREFSRMFIIPTESARFRAMPVPPPLSIRKSH